MLIIRSAAALDHMPCSHVGVQREAAGQTPCPL